MDGAPKQIALTEAERDLARHYRVGPSQRGYDDPSYTHSVEAFSGIGLRPYSPVHLRAQRQPGGVLDLSWTRRTRVGGDSWSGLDVPLGEAIELYLVRIYQGASLLREVMVPLASLTYSASMQTTDGVSTPFDVHVAQISDQYGPGPFARITIDD
jgi:hypothetical protein